MINDITLCAQNVVAMTGDCMGELESPPDCAADITSFMAANLFDAAEVAAQLSLACAGEETGCEIRAIDACECFSSVASDLIGASTKCDFPLHHQPSGRCLKQIIKGAVDACPQESALHHYLKTIAFPDWWGCKYIGRAWKMSPLRPPSVSQLYKAVTGSDTKYVGYSGSRKVAPHMGIVDQTTDGPIIAEVGLIRLGGAFVVPHSDILFDMGGLGDNRPARRLDENELVALELPTLEEVDIDVWIRLALAWLSPGDNPRITFERPWVRYGFHWQNFPLRSCLALERPSWQRLQENSKPCDLFTLQKHEWSLRRLG